MKSIKIFLTIVLILFSAVYAWQRKYNKQQLYLYGEDLGEYETIYEIYDYNQKGNLGYSDVWKQRDRFGQLQRNIVLFFEEGDRSMSISIREDGQYVKFTPYTLMHPHIDGVVISYMDQFFKKSFQLQLVLSRMSDIVDSSQSGGESGWQKLSRLDRDYLYAARLEFNNLANGEFFSMEKVSAAFVNQVHIDNDVDDILRGQYDYNVTHRDWDGDFYIQISDADPDNPKTFAALFSIIPEKGYVKAIYGGAITNLPNGSEYIKATDENPIIVVISGLTKQTKGVRCNAVLAGSYIVQISEENAFQRYDYAGTLPADTVLYSKGAVDDFSNLRKRQFELSLNTANQLYSLNVIFKLLNINFNSEFAYNATYWRYPSSKAEHFRDDSYIAYLQGDTDPLDISIFKKIGIFGDIYYTDPDYSTTIYSPDSTLYNNLVPDNDDGDNYSPWFHQAESYEGITLDRNQNSLPDFYEDFVLFAVDPFFFETGLDKNNNQIVDDLEDDDYEEYIYKLNRYGYSANGTFTVFKTKFTGGQRLERMIITDRRSYVNYLMFEKDFTFLNNNTVKILDEIKDVKDNIPDDVIPIKGTGLGEDKLEFENSLFNSLFISYLGNFFNVITINTKYRFDANRRYSYTDYIFSQGLLFYAFADLPLTKKITLTPRIKNIEEKKQEYFQDIEFIKSADNTYGVLRHLNVKATGVELKYQFFDEVKITTAYQYKIYDDFLESGLTYTSSAFEAGLVATPVYNNVPSTFVLGARYTERDYYKRIKARREEILEMFVRFYSKF